jgi:hypothetical protein
MFSGYIVLVSRLLQLCGICISNIQLRSLWRCLLNISTSIKHVCSVDNTSWFHMVLDFLQMSSEVPGGVAMAENVDIKSENVVACETVDEGPEKSTCNNLPVPNADNEATLDRPTLQAVLQFLKKYNLKVCSVAVYSRFYRFS